MKFQPITVAITIPAQDLYDVAQLAVDTLREDFGDDVVDCAGVDDQELFDAIMQDATFRKIVSERVKECGAEVATDPYDYFDGYDFLDTIPGLKRVVELCKEMNEILRDAVKEPEVSCIPVPAGYKLVRI